MGRRRELRSLFSLSLSAQSLLTFVRGQGAPVRPEEGAPEAGDVGRVPGAEVAVLMMRVRGGGKEVRVWV